MKILIIDSLFSKYGGGQIIAYNTYKILKEKGHEAYFWAMDKRPFFEEDYEYSNFYTPLYTGSKDYIKNPIKYYYNYRAKNDLIKFLDLIKPDLVHINSYWGLSTSIFEACKDIPTVLTLHDIRCCPNATLMFKNKLICEEQYCKNGNFLPCILHNCAGNFEVSIRHALLSYLSYHLLQ